MSEYVSTRFVTGKEDVINSKISKNFLKLPRHSAEHTIVNPVSTLKPSTIVKLRGACTQRPDLAKQLFAAEFTGSPECLVKDGQAFYGTKCQILKCIEPAVPSRSTNIDFQTYVVDVSVEVRSKAAILSGKIGMSYRDFVVTILNSIASKARESPSAQQIDLVIDFYHKFSIKSGVRTERGRAARALFELVDPLPKNFQELLTNDEFKTDLYNYFSDVEVLKSWTWDKDYSITKGKHVTERSSGVLSDSRVLCMHGGWQPLEEADNRMVLHIQNSLRILKRNKIVVRTVDSDEVVILFSFYPQFLLADEEIQLIVDFGVANNRRFINIQDIYEKIGKDTSLALPFFHAFTGCDSTAFFFKKSKMVLFKSWMSSSCVNELTAAFRLLSWLPTECIIQSCLPVVNNFIKSVFSGNGKSKQFKTLGDLRYQMFKASTNSNFQELPPTEQSLELHLRRSCYQPSFTHLVLLGR